MKKNKETKKWQLSREIVISICTIVFSGLISWIIAYHSNTRSAILDSQREILQKEAPVLNRIADMAESFEMMNMAYIAISRMHEIHITTYLDRDSTVVGQDTSFYDHPVRDTTLYFIPKFVVNHAAYNEVIEDLKFVEANLDILSHRTANDINDVLSFVKIHPIVFARTEEEIAESEWVKPEVYTPFINQVNQITQSYLKKLRKFGLD